MNHIPNQYEHLVRYYGYYSNRSRGARKQAAPHLSPAPGYCMTDISKDGARPN